MGVIGGEITYFRFIGLGYISRYSKKGCYPYVRCTGASLYIQLILGGSGGVEDPHDPALLEMKNKCL
jgi:hypothetical protein